MRTDRQTAFQLYIVDRKPICPRYISALYYKVHNVIYCTHKTNIGSVDSNAKQKHLRCKKCEANQKQHWTQAGVTKVAKKLPRVDNG